MLYPPRQPISSSTPIITLLTDFGLEDVYVGIMKGVIAGIHPQAHIIDLTHQIPPQNIALGSFQLGNAYQHFPPGTIHVAVVDPGVGSHRRAIAIQMPSSILIGPDNGLFSHVLMYDDAIAVVELTNSQYWYSKQPSNTFHGRDIFAPAAAYLAQGLSLQALGPTLPISSLATLPNLYTWKPTHNGGTGNIQAIDYFGNMITNVPASEIQNSSWSLQIGQHRIHSATSYATAADHPTLKALIGSHGWLEIALSKGSAHQTLNSKVGDQVQLHLNQ